MAEIKEWNKCNNCAHARVCNYSESRRELLDTMNKQLTSWCGIDYFLPEFFEFSFECKEFVKEESTQKKMYLKDILHTRGGAVDESLDWSRLPLDFL